MLSEVYSTLNLQHLQRSPQTPPIILSISASFQLTQNPNHLDFSCKKYCASIATIIQASDFARDLSASLIQSQKVKTIINRSTGNTMACKTKHSSYLGLPMEIRQKILHYTITDEDLEDDLDLVCKTGKVGSCAKLTVFNGGTTMFWADMLKSVHPVAKDDMCFVIQKWKSRGQEVAGTKPERLCSKHSLMHARLRQIRDRMRMERIMQQLQRQELNIIH